MTALALLIGWAVLILAFAAVWSYQPTRHGLIRLVAMLAGLWGRA